MIDIIKNKIENIREQLDTWPDATERMILIGQIKVLEEVLKTDQRSYNIAMIKEINNEWKTGLLTRAEYEQKLNDLKP